MNRYAIVQFAIIFAMVATFPNNNASAQDPTACSNGNDEKCLEIYITDTRSGTRLTSNTTLYTDTGSIRIRARFGASTPRYSHSNYTNTYINSTKHADKEYTCTSCGWDGYNQEDEFNLGLGVWTFKAELFGKNTITGAAPWADTDIIKVTIEPQSLAQPQNFRVTNLGTNGEHPKLAWDPVQYATAYDVYRCIRDPQQSSDCTNESDFAKIITTSSTYAVFDYGIRTKSTCYIGGNFYELAEYFVKAKRNALVSPASNESATCTDQAAKGAAEDLTLGATDFPEHYNLERSYPNPFNPSTLIRFALPETGSVVLSVYDLQGREVDRLVDGVLGAGYHEVTWDASNVPSGVYLYRMSSASYVKTRSMHLVK